MMYGYLDENYVPLFATFVVGDVLALSYVTVFYRWTKDRTSVHKTMAIAAALIFLTSLYCILGGLGVSGQTRHGAAHVAGIIAVVTGTITYASPLVKIIQVFKHKSAVFIPIHMVCMGLTNNVIWIVYSYLAGKWIIFGPSVFALCIGVFQMVLYFCVYNPKTHPLSAEHSENEAENKDLDGTHDETPLSVLVQSPQADTNKADFIALDLMNSPSSVPPRHFC